MSQNVSKGSFSFLQSVQMSSDVVALAVETHAFFQADSATVK
jgi:hypothetical protein